ncbi:MAG: right-handed parallel beta-helix repeat-containing protein [Luteimonas sp.]|nr:right-handed parallel beta-helix repeat-containing protein [Luteimonas sp.]
MHHAMRHLLATLVLLTGAATLPGTAHAETYNTCAGFIDSVPTTITTQGVWCLRKDLSTNLATGAAITINANNVTIDCNDFKIGGLAAGDASTATGIYAYDKQNATVRHCNVRGFYYGINLGGGSGTAGHLVEDNRLDNNLSRGIIVTGDNNRVRRNAIYDTGGSATSGSYGIYAYADVIDNTVEGVFATATNGSSYGIMVLDTGHVALNNQVRGVVPNGTGSAYGIHVGFGSNHRKTIDGNQVISDATTAITGTGIRGDSSFCRNNTVAGFTTAASGCEDVGGNAGF